MADTKLTALSAIGTLGNDDLFYVVDDPGGTPLSRKATGTQLKTYLYAQIELGGNLESNNNDIQMEQYSADAVDAEIFFDKSRNASIGSHTVVQDGDDLGRIVFRGSDGTNFEEAAYILVEVDGTPGNNDMPGRISIWTTPDASATPAERFSIGQGGEVNFAPGDPVNTLFGFVPGMSFNFNATMGFHQWSADANGPFIVFGKSRNTSIGGHTVVQAGDTLGSFWFAGSDGTDFAAGAKISAFVDNTPGAGDMPCTIEVSTSADASEAADWRLRITSTGRHVSSVGAISHFWVYWTANSTTILASYNMTSIADTGVGDADGTIAVDFSSANWAGFVNVNGADEWTDAGFVTSAGFNARAAGTFGVLCARINDGGTAVTNINDPDQWQVVGFGVSA